MTGILKFLLGLLLLPAMTALTLAFTAELGRLKLLKDLFGAGVVTYVFWHLFVFTLRRLFDFTHKVFSEIFRFSHILQSVMPRIVPLGAALLLLGFFIGESFLNLSALLRPLYFLTGFAFCAHVVLTAEGLYEEDAYVLKSHYFLMMCLAYAGSMFLTAALLDLNVAKFSFPHFAEAAWTRTLQTYHVLFKRYIL